MFHSKCLSFYFLFYLTSFLSFTRFLKWSDCCLMDQVFLSDLCAVNLQGAGIDFTRGGTLCMDMRLCVCVCVCVCWGVFFLFLWMCLLFLFSRLCAPGLPAGVSRFLSRSVWKGESLSAARSQSELTNRAPGLSSRTHLSVCVCVCVCVCMCVCIYHCSGHPSVFACSTFVHTVLVCLFCAIFWVTSYYWDAHLLSGCQL